MERGGEQRYIFTVLKLSVRKWMESSFDSVLDYKGYKVVARLIPVLPEKDMILQLSMLTQMKMLKPQQSEQFRMGAVSTLTWSAQFLSDQYKCDSEL